MRRIPEKDEPVTVRGGNDYGVPRGTPGRFVRQVVVDGVTWTAEQIMCYREGRPWGYVRLEGGKVVPVPVAVIFPRRES